MAPGMQNGVLCLACLEKNDKESKFPYSDTPLVPCWKPAGNKLKWLQGFPCRALQTCFLISSNRNTVKSLQYFLTCWDMEGPHLEVSEYQGPWRFSLLILLQLAITLRLGRNKFKSLLCNGFSLWVLWFQQAGIHCHGEALALVLAPRAGVQALDIAECLTGSFLLRVTCRRETCWPLAGRLLKQDKVCASLWLVD